MVETMGGTAWKIQSRKSCTYTYYSKRYWKKYWRIGGKAYPLAGISEAALLLMETS
jgi:hypothetical protein